MESIGSYIISNLWDTTQVTHGRAQNNNIVKYRTLVYDIGNSSDNRGLWCTIYPCIFSV